MTTEQLPAVQRTLFAALDACIDDALQQHMRRLAMAHAQWHEQGEDHELPGPACHTCVLLGMAQPSPTPEP